MSSPFTVLPDCADVSVKDFLGRLKEFGNFSSRRTESLELAMYDMAVRLLVYEELSDRSSLQKIVAEENPRHVSDALLWLVFAPGFDFEHWPLESTGLVQQTIRSFSEATERETTVAFRKGRVFDLPDLAMRATNYITPGIREHFNPHYEVAFEMGIRYLAMINAAQHCHTNKEEKKLLISNEPPEEHKAMWYSILDNVGETNGLPGSSLFKFALQQTLRDTPGIDMGRPLEE